VSSAFATFLPAASRPRKIGNTKDCDASAAHGHRLQDQRQRQRRPAGNPQKPASLPEDVPVIAGGEYPFARAIEGAKRAKITNYCKFPAPVNHQKGTIFSK
jgi:hypothetical protein